MSKSEYETRPCTHIPNQYLRRNQMAKLFPRLTKKQRVFKKLNHNRQMSSHTHIQAIEFICIGCQEVTNFTFKFFWSNWYKNFIKYYFPLFFNF